MEKENPLIKFFIPITSIIYGVGISLLAGSIAYETLSNLVELLGIVIAFFIIKILYAKKFSNSNNYKFQLPGFTKILGLFLITPLIIMLQYHTIYEIFVSANSASLSPFVTESLIEDIRASVSAVLLAPVYEELTFRYMTMTPFRKKSHRIIILVLTSLLFGCLHVRNFFSTFIDALILGILFLSTKNIIYSILFHSFNNLCLTIFGILSTKNLMDVKMISSPIILIFDHKTQIVFYFIAAIGLLLLIFGKKLPGKSKVQN